MTTTTKTALVTGANKGIGKAIARQLGALGHEVWLGARDGDRGRAAVEELAAGPGTFHLIELDVTSDASVAAAGATLAEQTDHLDVLVNNAGICVGMTVPPRDEPISDIQLTYDVNVFGPIRVTQAMLPLLIAAGDARIVMQTSGLGSFSVILDADSPFYGFNLMGYATSKSALNAVTVALAKDLAEFGIRVNATDPGYVDTDINEHSGSLTPDEGAQAAVRLATIGPDGPTSGFFNAQGPHPW